MSPLRRTAAILGVIVMVAIALAVLSVLLGITAEPETVIEQLVRWASGR